MKLVVVVPTYNEAGNIDRLINRIIPVLKKVKAWEWEILVVDDNSPDGTSSVVRELMKKRRGICLMVRNKKSGLGGAYFAGMERAFGKMGAELVVIMDADLSHDPVCIPQFIKKIKGGADFVVGSRYIKGGSVAQGWAAHRKFLSVFGNRVTTLMLGNEFLSDWTSGFRAIKREVYKKVKNKITDFRGYTFNISFAYFACKGGFKAEEVPIKFVDRTEGKSKLGFEYLFHTPFFLISTRLSNVINSILKGRGKS